MSQTFSTELLNAYRIINATIRRRGNDQSTDALKTAAVAILAEASRQGADAETINAALREATLITQPSFSRPTQITQSYTTHTGQPVYEDDFSF
jgi:hypothetical protein